MKVKRPELFVEDLRERRRFREFNQRSIDKVDKV